MRNLFHQTLGFVLGIAFGLLGVISAVSVLIAYVSVTSDSKKPKTEYKPADKLGANLLRHEYATRREAEEVLDELTEIAKNSGAVTVNDLAITLGENPTFANGKRGWKSLQGANITRDLYNSKFRINWPADEAL